MDDKNIIQLYWNREEHAISVTADKYGNYCFSIANNILDDKEDAEECVNDTYLKAWNNIPPHRPQNLSAFLGKITRNLSLNRLKYNTAYKRGENRVNIVFEEISELVSGTEDTTQEIDRKELVYTINKFLERLPTTKKMMFVCRYWYFDSISDIAIRFGTTENNVSVTLNRLRHKLKKYLLERGYGL